ncbi:hypothetical protein N8I77_007707 [Diaporthe amygdali]|uniref:Uncharacterized protein n=1 Tax=Phomopsis amygdali TaxID=1214568 RepID=A0AAD9W3P7_PHOAM|nr:hypothetical protein N8I77_007707 [Diaporthe amygdali]
MVNRYRHISHLTHEDINLLVRLLCLPPTARIYTDGLPSDQWLARQSEKISQLPKPLQRPQNWLARLSIYTNKKLNLTIEDLVPQCAVLCTAHKGLNPWVVHRMFLLISEEVTHRLDPVRRFLENPTKHAVKLKTSLGEVQDYVDRMNSMLSLWTGADVFSRIVGDNYPPGLAMPRIESDCEACICSCIGASGQALCDLRAMMYGRSHRRRPPVLIPLVEAWMDRFGGENSDRLWAESTKMARDVRHIRKKLLGRKSRHRRHRTPYEKRMKERARLERSLDEQRLSAHQVRSAKGDIDRKLDEMFGKESRKPDGHQGKHSSKSAAASSYHASSASNASSATIRPKSTHNDHSLPVGDSSSIHQQDSRSRTSRDDADDEEQLADYHDEFDEADADAAYKQQDRLQGWYDNFTEIVGPSGATDVGSQHPAFRHNAAEIENTWLQSQMAMSALPKPLHFTKSVTTRDGDDEVDEDGDDSVPAPDPARTQVSASEWTDVTVHTLATQSTHKSSRGGRPQSEVAPPVPRLPSVYRDKITAQDDHPRRPAQSTVTAWPGPNASGSSSHSSGHRRAPSSNTTLSSWEFQAGLSSIDQRDGSLGATLPTASLLPDDSVSAVAGLYPPNRPGNVHRHDTRQDQIEADAVLARQMLDMDLESDSDGEEEGDDDIRTAIENSRETVRLDEERRARAGRGGPFSALYMPHSSWL